MPINRDVLTKKLTQIKELVVLLENMEFDQTQFEDDIDIQHLVSFRLQQIIELCIDVATYIIANEGLSSTTTSRDSFTILAKKAIISDNLAQSLGNATGFRNLIVHQYADVDIQKVFRDYKTDIKDIREFSRYIVDFLDIKTNSVVYSTNKAKTNDLSQN